MSTPADLAFVNGAVYTVDAASSWARAVAVRDGRIVAVGTDDEIREHIGSATEVVDLDGKMLLPGFQDAHIHAPTGGMDRLRIDLSELHAWDDYARTITTWADANPSAPWVLGGGWAMDIFDGGTPSREQLDALVPDRPAYLTNRDLHAAWVNSKALEVAGVDASIADPIDGRFERTTDRAIQGTLHEGAMSAVRRVVPEPAVADLEAAILEAQRYLHALGITAWQDAIVGDYPAMVSGLDAYPSLAARGDLTARVVGALWLERGRGVEQVDELIETRASTAAPGYAPTSVKIMLDGVCENFTAAMLDPYLGPDGSDTANTGLEYFDPETLRDVAVRLDREGFQLHIHVIGDRACRDALDAIEAAREANGPSDARHHLAHIQVVHPDDLPRFRRLGVTANAQPLWAAHEPQMDELTIPFLGAERTSWMYPYASLLATGATVCGGSDWPVSTPDVLQEIHVAVHRTSPPNYTYGGPSDEVFIPDERIALGQAVRAFTMGSAYVNHLDRDTGSIEVGKLADLVVLSEDIFGLETPTDARVLLTVIGGHSVFEADRSGL
jgi:predicted amidohydrolase YtcJ